MRLFAEQALLGDKWRRRVLFETDDAGRLTTVTCDAEAGDAEIAPGPVVPGMCNAHSHAFQRAMAGYAERRGEGDDSFWTWRDAMYGLVEKFTPEDLEAIASQLYVEMLKSGFTRVAEFHYLHHDSDGKSFTDPAEMSARIFSAAAQTGIGLTHLPVLYRYSGFGASGAGAGQKRFVHDPDSYGRLLEAVSQLVRSGENCNFGIAPHSLRAVTDESISSAITQLDGLSPGAPIHIHIAEQVKEVEDCQRHWGARPVEWLLANFDVNPRWCLVHATHMNDRETGAVANSGAVAAICTTTEANLGDGFFPADTYMGRSGRFAVGSDSQISVSPVEELRWLEYGQRLLKQRRTVLAMESGRSTGTRLWSQAARGGAQACGAGQGQLARGEQADLLVLDGAHPLLLEKEDFAITDTLVFSGNSNLVRDVMVAGRWVVREGQHFAEAPIAAGYGRAIRRLSR